MKAYTMAKPKFWLRLRASFMFEKTRVLQNIDTISQSSKDEWICGNGFYWRFSDFWRREHLHHIQPQAVKFTIKGQEVKIEAQGVVSV